MVEHKLKQLVDLVLLVGPDEDTGLTYRYGHKKTRDAVDRYLNRNRRQDDDEIAIYEGYYDTESQARRYSMKSEPESENDSTDDEYGLVDHLTGEDITFHAQETQMFTGNEATYPHRSEEFQLSDYPQSIYTHLERLRDSNGHKMRTMKAPDASLNIEEQSRGFEAAASSTKTRKSLYTKQQSITPLVPNPGRRLTLAQVLSSGRKLSTQAIAKRVSELQINGMRDSMITKSKTVGVLDENENPTGESEESMTGVSTATMVSRTTRQVSLNADQINALCQLSFPEGLRCREIELEPRIIPYVLTNLEGDRFYAVTLTFYKKYCVTKHRKDSDTSEKQPDFDLFPANCTEPKYNRNVVFVPNCCVLVSSQPYFNTLQDCLTTYYKLLSDDLDNLDKITASLAQSLTDIPIPAPCDHIYIHTKVFPLSKDMITIKGSSHVTRAVVDLDLSILIKLFNAVSVCKILTAILTEQRIVFISQNYSLLTLIQETFMHIIYPFRWQSLYVPVLSSAMVGLVEAPGYLVMGAHRQFENMIKQVEGLMIVDLDEKKIVSDQSLTSHLQLPLQATTSFCNRMVDINTNYDLESAGFVVIDEKEERRRFRDKVNKEILGFSLDLMIALFGSIHRFLISEQKFFNQVAFLEQVQEGDREFYTFVLETTLFKQFLRERFANKFQDLFDVKALEKPEPISRRPRPTSFKSHERGQLIHTSISNHTLMLPNTDNFQKTQKDRMIQVEEELDTKEAQSNKLHKASLLYLLSSLALNRNLTLDDPTSALKKYAVSNLLEVEQLSPVLFPRQTLLDIIITLDQPEVLLEHTKPVHRPLLRELIAEAQGQVKPSSYDVKVDLDNLPKNKVNLDEFYKYAERLDIASDRKTIDRLFNAFTLEGETNEIEPDDINSFYECWKDNEAKCKEIELTCQAKHAGFLRNEPVLKVSSEVIRTSFCTGYLILTQRRLLLLDNSCKVEPMKELTTLSEIQDVSKVDIKGVFRATVEALRIKSSSPKLKDKSIDLFLRQDCILWQEILREMIGGKKIATKIKDMFMMILVARNVMLLNALITSSRDSQCYYGRDLSKAVDALVYYSLDKTVEALAIDSHEENDRLVHRLNPNSDELDCADVECLFYLPGTSNEQSQVNTANTLISVRSTGSGDSSFTAPPTLWCGMSNGKIRVFDAISWALCSRYVQAEERVVCLAYDGEKIWAGSFDSSIYIIDNNLSNLNYEKISEHDGFIVDLQLGPDQSTMYSADINGKIYLWDCKAGQISKTISVDTRNLTKILPVTPTEIWCGCKDKIVKIDSNGQVLSVFSYIDEHERREVLDSFQIVGDRLWAGCGQLGRTIIWDINSEERLGTLPVASRGVSQLVEIDGVMYIGCKISFKKSHNPGDKRTAKRMSLSLKDTPITKEAPPTVNKSILYAVNTQNCHVIQEMAAHHDTIRCIHAVANLYVITGSGSGEGKIAIWKHHSQILNTVQ